MDNGGIRFLLYFHFKYLFFDVPGSQFPEDVPVQNRQRQPWLIASASRRDQRRQVVLDQTGRYP